MGRHKNIDSFYLTQSYSRLAKQLIPDNLNFLIILKQDLTNLKHIYDDHVNTDFSFEKFKEMCNLCWKEKYGFLVINKDDDLNKGRFRKRFDCYIIP